ncbi:hypothetical protein BOX15_Mlig011772g1, partial [Macrostomum lignano]
LRNNLRLELLSRENLQLQESAISMGGTQSWLACDTAYPTAAPVPGQAPQTSAGQPDGNLLIAVLMFVITIFLLLSLTCIGHCIAIAMRRRKTPAEYSASPAGAAHRNSAAEVRVVVGAGEDNDENAESGSEFGSTDSDATESDIDSVTARAMQLAASRRMSRSPAAAAPAAFDNKGFVQ